jgi:hypothetical protein
MRLDNYVILNKKKFITSDKDLLEDEEDNHKRVKFVNNTQQDNNLDESKDNYKIIHLKEQNIKDPYNLPDHISKINDIHNKDNKNFDMAFLGFEDNIPIKNKKIDNAYLYGEPSVEELKVSNWQTEEGVSNPLNQRFKSIETGESLDDIKDTENFVDKEVQKIINELEKSDDENFKRIRDNETDEDIINAKIKHHIKFREGLQQQERDNIKTLKADIKPVIHNKKVMDLTKKNVENKAAKKITAIYKARQEKEASQQLKEKLLNDIKALPIEEEKTDNEKKASPIKTMNEDEALSKIQKIARLSLNKENSKTDEEMNYINKALSLLSIGNTEDNLKEIKVLAMKAGVKYISNMKNLDKIKDKD